MDWLLLVLQLLLILVFGHIETVPFWVIASVFIVIAGFFVAPAIVVDCVRLGDIRPLRPPT